MNETFGPLLEFNPIGDSVKITFRPLARSDFPLLLKWLETPHVKAWWDSDINWTPTLIEEKYGSRLNSQKINCQIILIDGRPIGYIQGYNAADFQQVPSVDELPRSLASFDVFIGDPDYIKKGIGSKAIELYLNQFFAKDFDYAFADPDTANIAAIRAYEKAGFKFFKKVQGGKITWMLKELR